MDYTGKDIIEMLEIAIEELKKHDVLIDAYFNKNSDFIDIRDIFEDVKKQSSLLSKELRFALNKSYLNYVRNLNPTTIIEDKKEQSTIYSNDDLVRELQRLNPDVDIYYDETLLTPKIICNRNLDELKLPIGFYYDDKNGLTNKHNTVSGMYVAIKFETKKLSSEELDNIIKDFDNEQKNNNIIAMVNNNSRKYVDAGNKKNYSIERNNKYENKKTKEWKKVLIILTVSAITVAVGTSIAERNMLNNMFGNDSISTSESTTIEETPTSQDPIEIPTDENKIDKYALPTYDFYLEQGQDIKDLARDILNENELLNEIYAGDPVKLANAILSQKPGANYSKYPAGEYYFNLGESDSAVKYLQEHPELMEQIKNDTMGGMHQ